MSRQSQAIGFILVGMVCITINDALIKYLSSDYPLHQMVFIRSALALSISFVFLHLEGGLPRLRTDRLGLHALRAGLVVVANMTFFAALSVMPLGAATALFFVAPLFISLLAIPVLGETIGRPRLIAIGVGMLGVVVMMAPGVDWGGIERWNLLLPVVAAACYAGMQVLTRKLGSASVASAMAIYLQGMFIVVSLGFFAVAGNGRFEDDVDNDALVFLLRAWVWPPAADIWRFAVLGLMTGVIGYSLSQAYRLGTASVVASYEYVALPLAVLWGWLVFGEIPQAVVWLGMTMIAAAGLYVFARERSLAGRARAAQAETGGDQVDRIVTPEMPGAP